MSDFIENPERKGVKKLTVAKATVAALLLLSLPAACGIQPQAPQVDDTSEAQPKTVIVYRDTDEGRSGAGNKAPDDDNVDDADDNMQSGAQLPGDFPIPVPNDYQVQASGTVGDETAAVLEVPSGEDAYNYYRQALAEAGFDVVDEGRNETGFFDAELEFSNADFEGNLDFEGNTVEVGVDRLD